MNGHTRELARFISETSYDDLSDNLRACIGKYFLDAVGCGLYGTTTESGRILSGFIQEQGGNAEATLWRSAWRGPVGPVALCLGTWMHAFELDDYHSGAKLHPGAVVFAAAFPLAEKMGANGEAFMTACAVGYETMIRASIAADALEVRRRGFHLTGLCGPFGAAAAAANLMRLNPEQTANALGLAGTQGAGTWAFQCDGSETKRFHAGRAAQSGLMAASLAERRLHRSQGDFRVRRRRFYTGVQRLRGPRTSHEGFGRALGGRRRLLQALLLLREYAFDH